MDKKIVYICGPITGRPNGNHIPFDKATNWYRNRGFEVINPYEIASEWANNTPECNIMRSELAAITVHVDFIAILPGWEKSRSALVEIATGIISGIPFIKAFSFDLVYPHLIIKEYGSETCKELVTRHNQSEDGIDSPEQMPQEQVLNGKHLRKTEKAA